MAFVPHCPYTLPALAGLPVVGLLGLEAGFPPLPPPIGIKGMTPIAAPPALPDPVVGQDAIPAAIPAAPMAREIPPVKKANRPARRPVPTVTAATHAGFFPDPLARLVTPFWPTRTSFEVVNFGEGTKPSQQ